MRNKDQKIYFTLQIFSFSLQFAYSIPLSQVIVFTVIFGKYDRPLFSVFAINAELLSGIFTEI